MRIKYLLILGLSFLNYVLAFSQADSHLETPKAKSFMIETNLNLFRDDKVLDLKTFQVKYWINNKTALRLGVLFDYKKNFKTDNDYESNAVKKPNISEKSLLFGFNPGIEYRLRPNSRISPYIGFEFSYKDKSSSSHYIDYSRKYDNNIQDYVYYKVETDIEGGWRKIEIENFFTTNGYGFIIKKSYDIERAYSSYGINFLLGTDIFILKNFYMGFEIGFGYRLLRYKQIKLDINDPEVTDPAAIEYNKKTFPSFKTSNFGFYNNNLIRLGVYF